MVIVIMIIIIVWSVINISGKNYEYSNHMVIIEINIAAALLKCFTMPF